MLAGVVNESRFLGFCTCCLSVSVVFDTYLVFCVAAVRKEIADETDRETGRSSKQISTVPIHLSIYSPNGM